MSSLSIQPDLVRLRRRAKELLKSAKAADPASVLFLQTHAPDVGPLKLAVAQLAVARSEGFVSWSELKHSAEKMVGELLFHAVGDCDQEKVSALLLDYPSCASCRNENGATLLHMSVFADDPELVRLLLKLGAPREALWGASAHTPLSWATTMGCLNAADALMQAGAQKDLFTAAGLGDIEAVRSYWIDGKLSQRPSRTGSSRLSESGEKLPRPPESDQDQVSDALYFAARGGHEEVVRWLLDHGSDPNFRGYEGGTSLHWAEFSSNETICQWLREAGASDELTDFSFQATPRAFGMICPAAYGMADRLRRRLEKFPEDINITGNWGTALNAAVWNNQTETVDVLLRNGADASLKNKAGLNALELAHARGYEQLLPLFESHNSQPEVILS
jgi:ankyrin repeat protein